MTTFPNMTTMRVNAPGKEVMDLFLKRRARRIYVTDDHDRFVGV